MTALQREIRRRGKHIFDLVDRHREPFLSTAGFYQRMMNWVMRNEEIKGQLFRFVDVLPSLHSADDVVGHLHQYFHSNGVSFPAFVNVGLRASAVAPAITEFALRKGISGMARQFIAGKDAADVFQTLRRLHEQSIGFTVDLLGEAVVSEVEAESYAAKCMDLLETLATETRGWSDPLSLGAELFPIVNLSIKISALYSQISPADPDNAIANLSLRLRPILRRTRELGAFVNFDMESYAHKNLTLQLFRAILSEQEFTDWPHAGVVIQAYLRDSEDDLRNLISWARSRGTRFAVRLVKGAYWDFEKINAEQKSWPAPVYLQKAETDANYERLSRLLLENVDFVTPAFGSHNVRSIAHAQILAEQLEIDRSRFEFQLLYGMAGPIKRALVELGYRVREYCPVGELLPGMAYLVRRLIENTSNEGFLRAKFSEHASASELLRDPTEQISSEPDEPLDDTFRNAPLVNFVQPEMQEQMRAALRDARSRFDTRYPLVIDGKEIWTTRFIPSVNPAAPAQTVGALCEASIEEAEIAVTAARRAFQTWRLVSADERAAILERAAGVLERRRFELAALEVFEVGKAWQEADADVREAVDFCLFYAEQMRQLGRPRVTQHVSGEQNVQHYLPRGVALVIAPWNFPLAILCGMTAAALVTGNTVIMKPAEQSAVCGAHLAQVFAEAGVPPGVLNFLPGTGEVIGKHLVSHLDVDLIAFTGSREVGLQIYKAAGETRPGQRELKRVICEMGGKNAVIIDADADLDGAIVDCVYSAFGYQGQKCSALSRLILLGENYDAVIDRLIAATASLRIGAPEEPGITVGPVIDAAAQRRISEYIEIGKREARLAYQASEIPTDGYYVPPTIFTHVSPRARIAREEIFGPVLSVFRVNDLDEAIALANDSDYALTGGFFSRSPGNIERVKEELMAGNVYINRSCTGAVVGRQPFGGFKMSGAGTKAGGEDYLLHFLTPRVVSENVVRRGFAPE